MVNSQKIILNEMPYYSQWMSREIVGEIISGKIQATNDPLWEYSGANNVKEYELWAKNICGMACLKMILEYWKIDSPPIIQLAKECTEYGGSKVNKESIDGLFYVPFCEYLKDSFQLDANSVSPLNTDEIFNATLDGNIFIVSVHYLIRKPDMTYNGEKGGHLVVVSGVDNLNNTIYINNPSGDEIRTQQNYKIQLELFKKYFAERGILIRKII